MASSISRPGEGEIGGDQVEAGHRGREGDVVDDRLAAQQLVDGEALAPDVEAQAAGAVALRVEVDEDDLAAQLGQGGAQVDGGRGLAHAALLVDDRDDARFYGGHQYLGAERGIPNILCHAFGWFHLVTEFYRRRRGVSWSVVMGFARDSAEVWPTTRARSTLR